MQKLYTYSKLGGGGGGRGEGRIGVGKGRVGREGVKRGREAGLGSGQSPDSPVSASPGSRFRIRISAGKFEYNK